MSSIQEWFRGRPIILSIVVSLLIVASSTLILIAPLKLQIAEVRNLLRPHVEETINSLELEKIGNAALDADVLTKEDGTYLGTQLSETLLMVLPGSVEVELSLYDIEYLFGQYADTRSFVESSAVSSDIIVQTILGIVIDEIFGQHAIETEEQIFQIITTYRSIYYTLVLLSLASIALVCFRRKFAVIVWLVPAAIITTGLAVIATVGTNFVAENFYEDMYIRFPSGMLAGLALAVVALLLHRKCVLTNDELALLKQTQPEAKQAAAEAKAKEEAETEAKVKLLVEQQIQSELSREQAEAETKVESKVETEVAAEVEPKPEVAQPTEVAAENSAETQAESTQESEQQPEAELAETEPKVVPEPEQPTEPEQSTDPEPEPEPQSKPDQVMAEQVSNQAGQAVQEAVQQLTAQSGNGIRVQLTPTDESHASNSKTIEIKLTIDVSTL
ncbi:MAG: procyclic acidic repetitive family protein [Coriobacteriales bacterium]|nr:procyclic acidic repetitive family protein [Coriobacteriales bacterium]